MHRYLATILAAFLFLAIPGIAEAQTVEPTITFVGAGWGHGVGMSQYGAQARARGGQTYQDILVGATGYYQGASLKTMGSGIVNPGTVFTNVASDITTTELTVLAGPGNGGAGATFVREGMSQTAVLSPGDRVSIVDTTPVSNQANGCDVTITAADGTPTLLGVGGCDITVSLTDGATTSNPDYLISATNCRRPSDCTFGYGVAFRTVDNASPQRGSYSDKTCPSPNGLCKGFDLVVETTLDDYTRGIMEVPFSWQTEALKAQAVAARSYAASFVAGVQHERQACFCDVLNDSSSQVYAGWIGPTPSNSSGRASWQRWNSAAVATNGIILTHWSAVPQGIVRAYYSSSNGGASEASADKWGTALSYLVSVPDAWSLTSENSRASWTRTFTSAQVIDKVWGTNAIYDNYQLVSAEVIERNASGSAKKVRFVADGGDLGTITKQLPLRAPSSGAATFDVNWFGLWSWYFDIDDSQLVDAPPPPPPSSGQPSGSTSVALQDPRTGIWSLRMPNGSVNTFYYGDPNDVPFVGDWNGNGIETVGLYRRSTGFLFIRHSNTQGIADIEIYYGIPGDIPIAGDWTGTGTDTVGVYRPSNSTFYLRNSNTQGVADITIPFGQPGDQPIVGDWDGDGKDTIGVYRPSTRMVYLTNDLTTASVAISFSYSGTVAGDKVIAGDWNADGKDTLGVFRPSTRTFYLRDTFTQSAANIVFQFGSSWMNPVAGQWSR